MTKRHIFVINANLDEEEWNYLNSCARIRDIAVSSMLRVLVETAARDQLVPAILDDEGKRSMWSRRYASCHSYREKSGEDNS